MFATNLSAIITSIVPTTHITGSDIAKLKSMVGQVGFEPT